MKLVVSTPAESFTENNVIKIIAGGDNGYFCLLPLHIDYVSTLKPGILMYETADNLTFYAAIDEGILVKKNKEVFISVRNAFKGSTGFKDLEKDIVNKYKNMESEEIEVRNIISKLESEFTRMVFEIK